MPMQQLPKSTRSVTEPFAPHEIDLRGFYAGDYMKIGGHWFIVDQMDATTRLARLPRDELGQGNPVKAWATLDLKLVHADWQGCDGH